MKRLTVNYSWLGHVQYGQFIDVRLLKEDRDLELDENVVLVDDAVEDRLARVVGISEDGREIRAQVIPSLSEQFAAIKADPVRAARIQQLREEMQEGVRRHQALSPEERAAFDQRALEEYAEGEGLPDLLEMRSLPDQEPEMPRSEREILQAARDRLPPALGVEHLAEGRREREERQHRVADWQARSARRGAPDEPVNNAEGREPSRETLAELRRQSRKAMEKLRIAQAIRRMRWEKRGE